jgi:hypothetical protein
MTTSVLAPYVRRGPVRAHAAAPLDGAACAGTNGRALLFSYFTGSGEDGLPFVAPPSQCHEL